MSVADIADALERAPRQGAATDDPEGARHVVTSETALNKISRELRLGSAERPDAEYFRVRTNSKHERTKSNDYSPEG
jgi:hypothetical protein